MESPDFNGNALTPANVFSDKTENFNAVTQSCACDRCIRNLMPYRKERLYRRAANELVESLRGWFSIRRCQSQSYALSATMQLCGTQQLSNMKQATNFPDIFLTHHFDEFVSGPAQEHQLGERRGDEHE